MKTAIFSLFIPDELTASLLAPLVTLAGLLMIFGFRKVAGGIIVFVLIYAFSPIFEPLIETLLDSLPDWMILLLAVFIVLQVLRFVLEVFLGKEAAGQVLASIVQSRITWMITSLLLLRWWVAGI
jgi:hypothetical protein